MKQKSKVRENGEYGKVLVFQWFFLLERLPLTDAAAAVNGIQEVSGSIPLISTKGRTHRWVCPFFVRGRQKPLTSCNFNPVSGFAAAVREADNAAGGSIPLISATTRESLIFKVSAGFSISNP